MEEDKKFEVWTEKYRPRKLDDILGQAPITNRLKSFVKSGNMVHMMFAGPPGCGKTTAALCVAKEVYGNSWKSNYLELNASDERGIDIVRNKIKDFARTKPIGVSYKIICLDEADALTPDAQHALRRTMEKYVETTRFILACNYSNKIIEPIQSRCAVFRFKPLDKKSAVDYLSKIVGEEDVKCDVEALPAIFDLCDGDMRRALNILQTAANGQAVTLKSVYDTAGAAKPAQVKKMTEIAVSGDFLSARNLLRELFSDGVAGEDIIREMASQVHELDLKDMEKVRLIDRIGEFEFRINQGSNPEIQLEALLAQLILVKEQ